MKGSQEIRTKFRINHPGKTKLWKFSSGKKSDEAQVGNHKEHVCDKLGDVDNKIKTSHVSAFI